MTVGRRIKALAWGHRRAVGPLEALAEAAASQLDVAVDLDVRPLAGFEHQPIESAASGYDLVVFDHPFCGDIVRSGCFVDMSAAAVAGRIDAEAYVGPSLESYRFGGGLWGAPMDAATQVAVYRQDLLSGAGRPVPQSWHEAVELGATLDRRGLSLGLALAAPHALLVLAGLAANLGKPWATAEAGGFDFDDEAMREALEVLKRLVAYCPADAVRWNSIDLHQAMVARDDVVYCPCVYGYATYGEADMRRRLGFAGFAGLRQPFHAGAVLGGAAIAVVAQSAMVAPSLDVALLAASETFQAHAVPQHHGQPAHRLAWHDPAVDERFNGFFSATQATTKASWIRPRFAGYASFQHNAGALVTRHLEGACSEAQLFDGLHCERDALNATIQRSPRT